MYIYVYIYIHIITIRIVADANDNCRVFQPGCPEELRPSKRIRFTDEPCIVAMRLGLTMGLKDLESRNPDVGDILVHVGVSSWTYSSKDGIILYKYTCVWMTI
jgi:hypothetical protein